MVSKEKRIVQRIQRKNKTPIVKAPSGASIVLPNVSNVKNFARKDMNNTPYIVKDGDVLKFVCSEIQIWDDAEGTDDYVSIKHDGSSGYINSQSGNLIFRFAGGNYYYANTDVFSPTTSNLRLLGSTTYEWKALYIGEDVNSGIFFGKDQDARLYYDEATDDALKLVTNAQGLQVWHSAEGTNDYISIAHNTNDGLIKTYGRLIFYTYNQDTTLVLDKGNNKALWYVHQYPVSSNTYDLGSTNNEWRGLYLGEDSSSGIYFGLDQDFRIHFDEANTDYLVFTPANLTNAYQFLGNAGMIVPIGTTAQRDSTQGMIRFNTTTGKFEGYDGSSWNDFH